MAKIAKTADRKKVMDTTKRVSLAAFSSPAPPANSTRSSDRGYYSAYSHEFGKTSESPFLNPCNRKHGETKREHKMVQGSPEVLPHGGMGSGIVGREQ